MIDTRFQAVATSLTTLRTFQDFHLLPILVKKLLLEFIIKLDSNNSYTHSPKNVPQKWGSNNFSDNHNFFEDVNWAGTVAGFQVSTNTLIQNNYMAALIVKHVTPKS